MSSYKQLRKFSVEELVFDETETRTVLKFIFKPAHHQFIDSLPMSDQVREFAQALLVEAIDASYAIGYVQGLIESAANPAKGARKIIKNFGRKASLHWFKHASVGDLQNVKIYNFVLDFIGKDFMKILTIMVISKSEPDKKVGAFLAYKVPTRGFVTRWG